MVLRASAGRWPQLKKGEDFGARADKSWARVNGAQSCRCTGGIAVGEAEGLNDSSAAVQTLAHSGPADRALTCGVPRANPGLRLLESLDPRGQGSRQRSSSSCHTSPSDAYWSKSSLAGWLLRLRPGRAVACPRTEPRVLTRRRRTCRKKAQRQRSERSQERHVPEDRRRSCNGFPGSTIDDSKRCSHEDVEQGDDHKDLGEDLHPADVATPASHLRGSGRAWFVSERRKKTRPGRRSTGR